MKSDTNPSALVDIDSSDDDFIVLDSPQSKDAIASTLAQLTDAELQATTATTDTPLAGEAHDIHELVNDLLDKQTTSPDSIFPSQDAALKFIREKLNGERKRLRVEQGFVLEEALAHYKSHNFDASETLVIQYRGQAAIDTGGVLRQFFTDVFEEMVNGYEDLAPFFEGSKFRKLPV